MADPLSVTSALIAIVTATIQSSRALYQAIQSLRDHPRAVRLLTAELESLEAVLASLHAFSGNDPSILVPLKLPLTQCTMACADFRDLLIRCTKHSAASTATSFRDWARLKYMDGDVNGFTAMLSGYKSTIAIALADANLYATLSICYHYKLTTFLLPRRSSTVTLQVLNEYKDMVRNTTRDLEDHLEEINSKLQTLTLPRPDRLPLEPMDVERLMNERDAAKQGLKICTEVLDHISELRLQPVTPEQSTTDISHGLSTQHLTRAHIMTLSALKECSDKLSVTLAQLRAHGDISDNQLAAGVPLQELGTPLTPNSDARRLTGEYESVRQCLSICSGASETASSGKVHVLNDVTIAKEGQQMLIATLGELFEANHVRLGEGALQVVASTSDETVRELFKAHAQRQL